MIELRQSSSAVINLGPAVSATDGVTLVSSLVSALDNVTTGIKLSKNGAAKAVRNGTPTTTVYDTGDYRITLNTTDTDTLGRLRVSYYDATLIAPMWEVCEVLTANAWDSKYATDTLQVDIAQYLGNTVPTAHTAGYPVVTIKDGTGTGELDTALGGVFVAVGGISGPSFTSGAISNAALATSAATEIAGEVLGAIIEAQGSVTLQQGMSYMLAVLAGVTTVSGATYTVKTHNAGATRVVFTLNASKERTAVVLTP